MNDQGKNNLPAGRQSTFSTLIVGIIIGAAVTYLFTNKEGQKLKDKLLKEGKKLLGELGENLEEIEEKVKEGKEEIEDKVVDKLEDVKENVSQLAEAVPQHIEQIQKKGRRFFFRKPQVES